MRPQTIKFSYDLLEIGGKLQQVTLMADLQYKSSFEQFIIGHFKTVDQAKFCAENIESLIRKLEVNNNDPT